MTGHPQAQNIGSAGPSHSASNNYIIQTRLVGQPRVIARLAKGEGVECLEWDGTVETGDICQKNLLGDLLQSPL